MKSRAVVALLELHGVDAALLRGAEELLRLLDAPLVVVADLRDDEAAGVVADPAPADDQLAHGAIVPASTDPSRPRHGTSLTHFPGLGRRLPLIAVKCCCAERRRLSAPRASVPRMPGSLSILMPVYNEVGTVEAAIDDALGAELPVESRQLVLVDDGSTDGTRELLRGKSLPDNVTVIYHDRNEGKGAAIRNALQHTTGEWSAILDADLEYRAADLAPLLRPLLDGEARVVFGTRSWSSHSAFSFWYVMGNKAVTFATNVIYNCWISDVMTCHKAMSTKLFRSLSLRERGFAIEPEITARVLRAGERIYEVPISYSARSREEGKKLTAVDGVRVLKTLVRCRIA